MVNYVRAQTLERKDRVAFLFIQGHGEPGCQSVGAGAHAEDPDGLYSLSITEEGKLHPGTERILRGMSGCFNPNAVITLGGCQVAGVTDYQVDWDQEGMKQNLAYAKQMGVPVANLKHQKILGTRLLKEISRVLGGVKVQAGTDVQRYLIPGMAGTVWRCGPEFCVNMGSNWWTVPT